MGENAYKPVQDLHFEYNENSYDLFIIAENKVEILLGEILQLVEVLPVTLPSGVFDTTLHIDVIRNSNQSGYYTAEKEIPILVDDKMEYQGPHGNLAEKIEDIRSQIEEKLSVLPPESRFYSITAIVYKADGSKGGEVTSTIAQNGTIKII